MSVVREKGRVNSLVGVDKRESNVMCFFQAEDGIRYTSVTGVQTCALPICLGDFTIIDGSYVLSDPRQFSALIQSTVLNPDEQIGRASCRERV